MWTDAGVSPEGGNTASERWGEEEGGGRGGGKGVCVRVHWGGGIHRSNPLPLPHRSPSEEEALNHPMNK